MRFLWNFYGMPEISVGFLWNLDFEMGLRFDFLWDLKSIYMVIRD